jgi:hypothetical protein
MSNTAGNLQFVSGSAGAGRTNGHIAMRGHSEASLETGYGIKTQLYMPSSSLEIGDTSAAGANVANDARVNIVSQGNERTLKITAKNDGTNGARSVSMEYQGYEGRAAGAFYYDVDYTGHEWYVGTPYAANHQRFMIGYDDGGFSEYQVSASIMIHPNSKVEIGTSTTNYDLQVYGSLTTEGPDGGAFVGTWAGNSGYVAFGTANMAGGEYALLTNGTDTYVGAGTGGKTFFRGPANDSTPQLVNDGTNIYLENAGNFGIGVVSPEEKLHIFGDAPFLKIENNTEDASGIVMEDAQDPGQNGRIVYDSGANKLYLQTHGGTGFEMDSSRDIKINESLGIGVAASSTTGRLDCSNDVVAFSTSDERLKENIKPLDNALDKVLKISGVSFDWKELTEEEKKTIHGNEGHDIGVIAQEIEEVLPEVVTERESGYKAVKYEKIVPLLIESIKEQQKQIENLKKEIKELKK